MTGPSAFFRRAMIFGFRMPVSGLADATISHLLVPHRPAQRVFPTLPRSTRNQGRKEAMLETPQIIETDEQLTAVIHLTVPRAEIASVMGPAIAEIMSTLAAQGVALVGPCFSYHWKRPTDTFDFEVGFPVNNPIASAGRVKLGQLPAVKVVRTTYSGAYEGLDATWSEFCAWIATQVLNAQDSLWERYLSGPESSPDPEQWRTELNRPLAA